jgi:protein O-mannosyl-transferase
LSTGPYRRRAAFAVFTSIVLAATILIYAKGLSGPFLFDDTIHITQNRWVHIDSLAWADLSQAWHSSFLSFPSDRPLAQLSFGVNHALSGLDSFAFKATNLAFHLLCGIAVFWVTRLVMRLVPPGRDNERLATGVALLAAAFWLLHPIHVSTVLYTVQRMAQLSTLASLLALGCYLLARRRIAEGQSGLGLLLAVPAIAAVGFLGKENTVLVPVYLLVAELTVLRGLGAGTTPRLVHAARVLYIALPLMAALAYLATHPWLLNHGGRPFTLEERLLTEARVLWLYLRWLLVPDVSAFALFHDGIPLSRGLLEPVTTALAVAAHVFTLAAAWWWRRRWPLLAFGVLFFYAAHLLESTVFPLEPVFEHRNYLASMGPLLLLAYAIVAGAAQLGRSRAALFVGLALLVAYGTVTAARVTTWTSYERFVLDGVTRHPDSARYNFLAGKLLIGMLNQAGAEREEIALAARDFLGAGLAANPACANCRFGLLILDMHLEQTPSDAAVQELEDALRYGRVDATTVAVSHFSFLVEWQRAGNSALPDAALERLFDAALANKGWNRTGRAGVHAAYAAYFESVAQDLEKALYHAEAAARAWPDQWAYHVARARLLDRLKRSDEAVAALTAAESASANQEQWDAVQDLRRQFGTASRQY